MKKISQNLSRILLILVGLSIVGINLAFGYIMFAPDSWPKPFYLLYQDPAAAASAPNGTNPQQPSTQPTPTPAILSTESAPAAPVEIRAGQGLMVDTGTKIINLVDQTGRKYLRVSIVLEYAPTDLKYYTMQAEEKTAFLQSFKDEITTIMPVINDTIITLLSSKTFESVYTADGKEKLRQEIMNTLNTQLPEHRVIFVYFTEFVLQ